jgi:predicted ATP-grasp superfamily ATP-dependent carboligase
MSATLEKTMTPAPLAPQGARVASRARMCVVVICHLGRSAYNVQRALAALGIKTYLITDERSASVRFARGCTVLHHVPANLATANEATIIKQINDLHVNVGITSVISTDVTASLFLARIRDRLIPPIFPISSSDVLRRLDDKAEFAKICAALSVDIPATLSFDTNNAVDLDAIEASLHYPLIVKPSRGFGQNGVVKLADAAAVQTFRTLHTHDHGMVIQDYIEGRDWSLSVFAVDGVVRNWTAWECPSQLETSYGVSRFMVTKFSRHDALIDMVKTVISALEFSGVANFDARLGVDGRMVLLECNPRFFNRMLAARIGGGLNFVAAALPGHAAMQRSFLCDGTYYPWQYAFTMRGLHKLMVGQWPWRFLARDLYELMRDPLPPLVRRFMHEERV